MIDCISRYLTDPPCTVSDRLASLVHPPSSCVSIAAGSLSLR